MIISDIKDARDGDWITFDWRSYTDDGEDDVWEPGHNGPVRIDIRGDYMVADTWVAKAGGVPAPGVRVTHIERPDVPLPTEPMSLITDVDLGGGAIYPLAIRDIAEHSYWCVHGDNGAIQMYVDDDAIVSFTLAKVVPA